MRTAKFPRPLPVKTREAMPFWEGCSDGYINLQRCEECEELQWFPRSYCRFCSSTALTWIPASGRGVLVTFTIVRRPMNPDFADAVPYVLAIVELDEGLRMMTNVVDIDVDDVRLGMAVEVDFEGLSDGTALPVFRPVHSA